MKHVFIINPVAGKGRGAQELPELIEQYFQGKQADYQIHVTTRAREATEFVRRMASGGEVIRFYACGGDGTLNEVVNGAMGFAHVEVTHVPCGSGNDFVKVLPVSPSFREISRFIEGRVRKIDVLSCADRYCVNICSVGLDAEVGFNMEKFKKISFVSGKMAYILSLVYCFFKKIKGRYKIFLDNETALENTFNIIVAANGGWYGGSFNAAPNAVIDDGLIDFLTVENVGRLEMLKLLGPYKSGRHEKIADRLIRKRVKRVQMIAEQDCAVNIDGEYVYRREVTVEMLPAALSYVVPV